MRNCSLSGGLKREYKSISCQGWHAILVLFGRIELPSYLSVSIQIAVKLRESLPFLSFENLGLQSGLTSSQGIVKEQLFEFPAEAKESQDHAYFFLHFIPLLV